MDDQHRADRGRLKPADLKIARPTAELANHRIDFVGCLQDGRFVLQQSLPGSLRIGNVEHLDLGDHLGRGCLCLKTSAGPDEFRHERRAGDHRRFFDGHWNEHLTPVNQEVERNPQREPIDADGVLDHRVRQLRAEAMRAA